MLNRLGFTKLAKENMLSKLPRQIRPNETFIKRTNEMVSTFGSTGKKDKTLLWESAVTAVAKDANKYQLEHGSINKYIPSRVEKVRADINNPKEVKKGIITAGAGLVARNNPKLKPWLDGAIRGKVEFKRKHDSGTETKMGYTFPKGKGDLGRIGFTWNF